MRTKIIALVVFVATVFSCPAFAQNTTTNTVKTENLLDMDLSALDSLSEFSVMKMDETRFKVEDFDGNDVSGEIKSLKTPNKMDLLLYDPETNVTSICAAFYSEETAINEWLPCNLVPDSPTGLLWVLSNNYKSFYIVKNGSYLDMSAFKLKTNPSNPDEYFVQENGVDKYVMKNLKGKNLDEFYPLELLK